MDVGVVQLRVVIAIGDGIRSLEGVGPSFPTLDVGRQVEAVLA